MFNKYCSGQLKYFITWGWGGVTKLIEFGLFCGFYCIRVILMNYLGLGEGGEAHIKILYRKKGWGIKVGWYG